MEKIKPYFTRVKEFVYNRPISTILIFTFFVLCYFDYNILTIFLMDKNFYYAILPWVKKKLPLIISVDGFRWWHIGTLALKNHLLPPKIDHLRAWPGGYPYPYKLPILAPLDYETSYWPMLLIPFFHSYWTACVYAPPIFAIIIAIILFIFVYRATNNVLCALVASTLFALVPVALYRFQIGFYDHDVFLNLYMAVLLWLTFELFEQEKISNKKLAIVGFFYIVFLTMFIASSKLWQVYLVVLSLVLLSLPLFEIYLDRKVIVFLIFAFYLCTFLPPRYTYNIALKKYSMSMYLHGVLINWKSFLFLGSLMVYLVATYISNNYENLKKRFNIELDMSFKMIYLLFLFIVTAVGLIALFKVPALRNKFIVIKPVGLARTIAEWQPLINWHLVDEGKYLDAIMGMIQNIAIQYDPWFFYPDLALLILSWLFVIWYVYTDKKIDKKKLLYMSLVISYFVLSISIGFQGVRLLSQFIISMSLMLSIPFMIFDEESIIKFFKEEKLNEKLIAKSLLSLALLIFFFVYYALVYNKYYSAELPVVKNNLHVAAISTDWIEALKWSYHNLKPGAFNSWWDYGDWIYDLSRHPVTIDAGHAYDSMEAKKVYRELLSKWYKINKNKYPSYDYINAFINFLGPLYQSHALFKFYNVSYFAISNEEIGKFGAISYNAQYAAQNYFGLPEEQLASFVLPCAYYTTNTLSNNTTEEVFDCQGLMLLHVLYQNGKPIDAYIGPIQPYIGSKNIEASALVYDAYYPNVGQTYWFKRKDTFLVVMTKTITPGGVYDGALLVFGGSKLDVPKIVNSTFVQLYLIDNQTQNYYDLVYINPKQMKAPLVEEVYGRIRAIGPMEIWKVK